VIEFVKEGEREKEFLALCERFLIYLTYVYLYNASEEEESKDLGAAGDIKYPNDC
jgi:hypothetical protein